MITKQDNAADQSQMELALKYQKRKYEGFVTEQLKRHSNGTNRLLFQK